MSDIWNTGGFEFAADRHGVSRTYPPCNLNHGGPCGACGELSQIETEIEEMQARMRQIRSTIQDLHQKHCAISAKRNALHRCSITKLPYEIASDIFIRACISTIRPFCIQTDNDQEFLNLCHPTRLATVCRSWRELAFSIPELWSSFSITPKNIRHINCCLKRSGTSPLFVQLNTLNGYLVPEHPSNALAITLVKQNIHRTAYLCLSMSRELLRNFTSRFIWPDAAPLLDEFHIHVKAQGDPCSIGLGMCTSLPKPSKIVASGYLVNKAHIDWFCVSQLSLRFYYMDSSTLAELLDLLSMAKSLVEFDCHCMEDYFLFPNPHSISKMYTPPSIRKITLHDRRSASAILWHTTMPSLELLTLSNLDPIILDFLSPFLERSACPLTSLELSLTSYPRSQRNKLLSFVKRLSLSSASNTSHDLPAQSQVDGLDTSFVPHLRKFKYSGPLYTPISDFLDIMENRSTISNIRALEELTVSAWCSPEEFRTLITEHDLQRIRELRADRTISIFHLDLDVDVYEESLFVRPWFDLVNGL